MTLGSRKLAERTDGLWKKRLRTTALFILAIIFVLVWVNLQLFVLSKSSSHAVLLLTDSQMGQTLQLFQNDRKTRQVSQLVQPRRKRHEDDPNDLNAYRDHVKDRFQNDRLQVTESGGAFVHIGKTGGSSLSILLRNGCHSFLQHPCRSVPNETLASILITSYYHVADFGLLPESNHDFYLMTTRDPYDRTISAFVYEHYSNLEARNESGFIGPRVRRNFTKACQECFPTLETFVSHLGLDNGEGGGDSSLNFDYPHHRRYLVLVPCRDLARAVFHGRIRIFNHLYFNYQKIQNFIPDAENKTFLVTRFDHLWQDWATVNQYLSQDMTSEDQNKRILQKVLDGSVPLQPRQQEQQQLAKKGRHSSHHVRNMAQHSIVVTRKLTAKGQQILCRALQPEYDAFFWFLSRAKNLDRMDVAQALALARKKCPDLSIDFKSLKAPKSIPLWAVP